MQGLTRMVGVNLDTIMIALAAVDLSAFQLVVHNYLASLVAMNDVLVV